VLTVKAEHRLVSTAEQVEMQVAERPLGVFSRQLLLGDTSTPSTSTPATTP
jgi:HSP20 family protein